MIARIGEKSNPPNGGIKRLKRFMYGLTNESIAPAKSEMIPSRGMGNHDMMHHTTMSI